MLPELNALCQSIEKRKAEMLAYFESLPDAERVKSPTTAEWSPLQVMDHVVIVEEWMAGPNAAVPPTDARVLMKGRLFMAFGGTVMRSALRVPTLPAAAPHDDLDFAAIKQRWDVSRTMLCPKLAAVTPGTRPLPIALHPVAGPLNAKQVLLLLDIHLAYHWRHFPRTRASGG